LRDFLGLGEEREKKGDNNRYGQQEKKKIKEHGIGNFLCRRPYCLLSKGNVSEGAHLHGRVKHERGERQPAGGKSQRNQKGANRDGLEKT